MANKPTKPNFPLGLESQEQSVFQEGILNNGVVEHGPDAVMTVPETPDASGVPSAVRYNEDDDQFEGYYNEGGWLPLGGGNGGRWEALPYASSSLLQAGRAYLVDNTDGVSTVLFPSPKRIGDSVTVCDLYGKFSTYPLTVDGNGKSIYGSADSMTISTDNVSATFTWTGEARGWVITSGVGLGQGRVYSREIYSQVLSAETSSITLSTQPTIVDVYADGKRLKESLYTLDGYEVKFDPALASGSDVQIIQYIPIQLGAGGGGSGGTVITWEYNGGAAVGGETQIVLDVVVDSVSEIYIRGQRQQIGRGFTFDAETSTITLADELETGDDVVVIINGDPTVYNQIDRTPWEVARANNVSNDEVILSTDKQTVLDGKTVLYDVATQTSWGIPEGLPAGVKISTVNAGVLVYTPGNVSVEIEKIPSTMDINSKTGWDKIGTVSSFDQLKTIIPTKAGQFINLRSYNDGWSAMNSAPVGGGIFISKSGGAVDDGGYICVPTGQTEYYWERVLEHDEYLTPQMYGYIPDYNTTTYTGTDVKPYIQAAIDTSISINKGKVHLPEANYYTAIGNIELAGTGHNRALGVRVYGVRGSHRAGGSRVFFNAPAIDTPLFLSVSPSSLYTMHGIDDLWLEAVQSNLYSGYALKLVGSCHMVCDRIHVERMRDGLHLLNTRTLTTDNNDGDQNGFCEFNAFRDWNLNKCYNNVSFNNDGTGDPSLNGNVFINMKSQLKEDGNGIYFNGTNGGLLWYNSPENSIKFWGGAATGVNTCQLLRVEGTEVRGVGGGMTWEGFGRISCDANSYFRFDGNIFGLPGNKALIDYSGVVGENNLCDARVIFNNTTSRDRINMSNAIMSPYFFRPIMSISRSAKNNTNYAVAMPIRITTSATEKPTTNTEYEGLAFPTNHNGDVWFGEVVSQSNWFGMIPTLKYGSSSGSFTSYTAGITWNIKNSSGADAGSNAGWVMGTNFYPLTTLAASLGLTTNRLNAIYANGGQITTSGIFPRTTAAYDLGSPTAAWNNLHIQNSPNVISDSNLKPVQEDLSDAEIEVAKICSKLFIKYKLAAAIAEKGDSARYHFGVVAQKVMAAFSDNGLSVDSYGVLVTSTIKQVVVKSGENYEPIPDENGEIHIPANDDGFIELIDGMDDLSTDEFGVVVLTRTTHLIRYEELLCFINAGMVARLEALEARFS
ncbi:putative tailspike protein [Klebsiella virus vB_KpnM-20]|nr:putative tailspike protein [Klebsiella virus vB_KpnM-20]